MKRIISILCAIGAIIFFAAVITAEADMIRSMKWILASALMMAPYLRVTYLRERG